MGSRRRVIFSTLSWVLLGGWLGSQIFFVAAVTPAVLSSGLDAHTGGALVSRTLGALELAGAGIGAALALLSWVLGRGRLATGLPLLLSIVCLVSHFGVTAGLAEARPPWDSPAQAARFARMHSLSVGLFVATALGTLALVGVQGWADARLAAESERAQAASAQQGGSA